MSTAQQKRWDTGLLSVHVTQTKVLIGVITIEPSGIPSVYMTGDRQNVYHCQLSLSLSLSLTHTHTHTYTRARTRTYAHTHCARAHDDVRLYYQVINCARDVTWCISFLAVSF